MKYMNEDFMNVLFQQLFCYCSIDIEKNNEFFKTGFLYYYKTGVKLYHQNLQINNTIMFGNKIDLIYLGIT